MGFKKMGLFYALFTLVQADPVPSSCTPVTFSQKDHSDVSDGPLAKEYNNYWRDGPFEKGYFNYPPGWHKKNYSDRFKNKDMYPFEDQKTGLYGYKLYKNHTVIIQPKYRFTWPFNAYGIAFVATPGQTFWIINTQGKTIAESYRFDQGPDYYNKFGLSRCIKNGKMGCMHFTGKMAVEPDFDWIGPFLPCGVAPVAKGCAWENNSDYADMIGGKWGMINTMGKLVIPMDFTAYTIKNGGVYLFKGREIYRLCQDKFGQFHAIQQGHSGIEKKG